jgi:hypothetical protein
MKCYSIPSIDFRNNIKDVTDFYHSIMAPQKTDCWLYVSRNLRCSMALTASRAVSR